MDTASAVTALIQSEKIKAGLIWADLLVEQYVGMDTLSHRGAVVSLRTLLGMIGREVLLGTQLAPNPRWTDVETHLDMALVMVDSNVVAEAGFHLARAVAAVTGIAQEAMEVLRRSGLI